jgi:regulator of sigma D
MKMIALLLAAALAPNSKAGDIPATGSEAAAHELRQSTQALLDAVAPGEVSVWERLLDEQAIQVDENDVVRSKRDVLAELMPLGPGLSGQIRIDDFRVIVLGDTAVVTHEDDETLDYHGQVLRSRFRMTDTWIHQPSGWRLLASQVLAVPKDPPARALGRKALCAYAGTYSLTSEIRGTIRCTEDELLFERAGRPARHFKAELADVFFEPGQPRTRRIFRRDTHGAINEFVDRREGQDVLWRQTHGPA